MFRQYLKFIKWLFIISALVNFVVLPLIPVYGLIRPWPEAEDAVRRHGIAGALFMVGGGSSSHYSSSSAGESWSKERTRTFLAVPESFRAGELLYYVETRRSGVTEAESEVVQEKGLLFLFAIWLVSAIISVVLILRWIKQGLTVAPRHVIRRIRKS